MDLVVTEAGLQAAADAEAGGLKIVVPQFAVGSAYNYEPSEDDDNLHGTILHQGSTANFYVDHLGQIHYTCWMNETVGNFTYGELGLYLEDGTLFALGSMSDLQVKTATVSGSRGNIVSIDVIIAVHNLEPVITAEILDIAEAKMLTLDGVYQLHPPQTSPTNAYLIHETDDFGNTILAYRGGDLKWCFNTHAGYVVPDGIATSISSTQLTSPQLTGVDAGTFPRGRYIVAFISGNFAGEARVITSIDQSTGQASWSEPLVGSGAPGDMYVLVQSSMSYFADLVGTVPAHTHPISQITGLQGELNTINSRFDNYSLLGHTHPISAINGLQAILDSLASQGSGTAGIGSTNSNSLEGNGYVDLPLFQIRFGHRRPPSGNWSEGPGPTVQFKDHLGNLKPFTHGPAVVVVSDLNVAGMDRYKDCVVQVASWNNNGFQTYINEPSSKSSNNSAGFSYIAFGL